MPEPVPFVDLAQQTAQLRGEIDAAIARVVDSGQFVLGPEVESFEAEFARWCGVPYAIGVSSGTDALVLAMRACGVGPGDEVIVPSHSFIAAALAVALNGATPVFTDIDPATFCIDPAAAEEALTDRTKALVAVHMYGQLADLAELRRFCDYAGVRLIEDAAQAHGAERDGKRAGALGDVGCFSFYPSKNLGALGDGGAVVTVDDELAEALRRARNCGEREKYHHDSVGWNSRLDPLQAAVLSAKLPHLDGWNEARRSVARRYDDVLAGSAVGLPEWSGGPDHVFHVYAIRSQRRDELQAHLAAAGVRAQIHYPVACHRQPVFSDVELRHPLEHSERAAAEVLSLPMYPELSGEQVERVCAAVRDFGA